MTLDTPHLKTGDIIRAEIWDSPVRVDELGLMGDFLKLKVKFTETGMIQERLLHKSKQIDLLTTKDEWQPAQIPSLDDLKKELSTIDLQEGMIVNARERLWRIDSIDNKSHTVTVYSISGNPSRHELYWPIESITPANFPPPDIEKVGSPQTQRMLLQSLNFSLLHSSAVLTGLQKSSVIPMPFQLVPVIMALNLPKARLLLADDVGLGKTIEAGLILRELAARNKADRILIVTPANLCEQWQGTMSRFFHFDFKIMSRRHRRLLERELLVGGNPWLKFPRLIVSIDYIKQDNVLAEALATKWDVVVVDEAHKIAKPPQKHSGQDPTMKRYQLGKKLAEFSEHLLLLTATPHNGYRDSFVSLLTLLNKDMIRGSGSSSEIKRDIAKNHICQRRRKDVEQWFVAYDEKSPFPKSDRREVPVEMSLEQEKLMHELKGLSRHIIASSGDAARAQRLAQWTAMHFYKRTLSSVYAIECSIKNRIARINERIKKKMSKSQTLGLSENDLKSTVLDDDPSDELSEEEIDLRAAGVIFGETNHVHH